MKWAAAAAATIGCALALPATAAAPGLDAARLGAAIRSAAHAHFGLWDAERRASFAAAWTRYRATSPRLAERDAVDLEAIRLVASLRNARSRIEDPAFDGVRRWRLPFVLRYLGGSWIATQSRSREIPSGAELRGIDGVAPERFYAAHRDLVFASSDAQARTLLETMIRCVDDDAHPPHLAFDEGREVVPSPAPPDAFAPRVIFHWLIGDRIGYVAIPGFDDPAYERDALTAVKHFITAEAIVIDVRGNEGGKIPVDLLELITDRWLPWWKESSNAAAPGHRPAAPPQIPPADGHYRGRVVLLADERCAAACEDFVMPLVYGNRARFVGTRTFGSTGRPYAVQLDGGITLEMASSDAALPDGSAFEGVGIPPTDPAPLRPADVRAGADVQLGRAIAVADSRPEMRSRP